MTRFGITRLALFISLIIANAVFSAPAASQTPSAGNADDLLAVTERLKLKLPINVYGSDPVDSFSVSSAVNAATSRRSRTSAKPWRVPATDERLLPRW